MSVTHTPGPWYVFPLQAERFSVGAYRRGSLCVKVAEAPPRRIVTGAGDDSIGELEAQANARLVAVAPDLLALAHQYADECAECSGNGVVWTSLTEAQEDVEEPCPACADIRAVINKAEGHI